MISKYRPAHVKAILLLAHFFLKRTQLITHKYKAFVFLLS